MPPSRLGALLSLSISFLLPQGYYSRTVPDLNGELLAAVNHVALAQFHAPCPIASGQLQHNWLPPTIRFNDLLDSAQ